MRESGIFPEGKPQPLPHPELGKIQGKYNKGVIQYLGLKYASLEHRFAKPELQTSLVTTDATKHGPPVLTHEGSIAIEMSFIQAQIPAFELPPVSDIEGLNLNVTVPLEGGSKLPVLVFIHGGGFIFGSGTHSFYDQSKLVELSSIMEQPVVAVNLNYRLGIPGFLYSQEMGRQGIPPNRGLLDQKIALKWIQRYIAGFGGDPGNVTVIAQSAGAAAVTLLMHGEQVLFHQSILLGGSFLMMRPLTPARAEELYQDISKTFKVDDLPESDRVQKFVSLPAGDLVSQLTPALTSLGPVMDGLTIPNMATFVTLREAGPPGSTWCKRIFLVESELDGSIFAQVNLSAREAGIREAFLEHLEEQLGKDSSAKVLQFYGLKPDTVDAEIVGLITEFITDIMFFAPAVVIAEHWPGFATLGLFNERNPWDGPYKGQANHLLDVAYVWGNYNQVYTKDSWTVARAFAESVISFTCGNDNLPRFDNGNRKVTVFGPSEEGITSFVTSLHNGTEARRQRDIFGLAADVGGLDILLDTAQEFLKAQI